jgi:hypothetical protein
MPTRRDICLGLAALAAGGVSSARANATRSGAVALGRAAVQEHPHLAIADLPLHLDTAIVRADFRAARVVKVQGWVLARHEVLWSIGQARQAAGV